MAEVGITAIVVGAILFALGFFPGLLPALMERFQGLLDRFVPSRGRIHKFQTYLPLHLRRLADRQWWSDADPRVARAAALTLWPLL